MKVWSQHAFRFAKKAGSYLQLPHQKAPAAEGLDV